MKIRNLALAATILTAAALHAQTTVKRTYDTPTARHASFIWAGDTLYVAGQMAPAVTPADAAKGTPADYGDTATQAESIIRNIEKLPKSNGLTLADIVQMECYVAGDPKMDFAGLNTAYAKFFGTEAQPNRPVRAAVQVASLPIPLGLVEIMVTAVRSK